MPRRPHYHVEGDNREPADPRDLTRSAGWQDTTPLYSLFLDGVPPGTTCAAGTTYPAPEGEKHSFVVHLEMQRDLSPLEARRLLRQVFRAVVAQAGENRHWGAAARLGAQDHPNSLPWGGRPGKRDVHCFWAHMLEYERPVLAFRTHYETKEFLKRVFNEVYEDVPQKDGMTRSGWWKEAKVWWIYATHSFPRVLGMLRREGFRMKWIQRSGFPPAPPIEEL